MAIYLLVLTVLLGPTIYPIVVSAHSSYSVLTQNVTGASGASSQLNSLNELSQVGSFDLPNAGVQIPNRNYFYGDALPSTTNAGFGSSLARSSSVRQVFVSQQSSNTISATSTAGTWSSIGPQPIATFSEPFTWGVPPFSGRVTAIAVNNSNPSIIYLGGAQGGVWKSSNGGTSWSPLTDSMQNLAVGAMAISPDNKTLYVGTGEANQCFDCFPGFGLLKSTNGGTSWSVLGGSTFSGMSISSILINPANASQIFVATASAFCCNGGLSAQNSIATPSGTSVSRLGIYLTLDGGKTWSQSFGDALFGVADLTLVPAVITCGLNNVLTHFPEESDWNGNVYRFFSGGYLLQQVCTNDDWSLDQAFATWVKEFSSSSLFPSSPQYSNCGLGSYLCRITIAASPQSDYLFAAGGNSSGYLSYIIEFNLVTGLVYQANLPPDAVNNNAQACAPDSPPCTFPSCNGGQAWYDFALAVDPINAGIFYIGCTELYRGVITSVSGANLITSWTDLGGYSSNSVIHPDQHAIAIVPGSGGATKSTKIFNVNDGGIWGSTNQGTSWTNLNNGLSLTQFYYAAVSNDGKLILGGAQDNGCNEYSGSVAWNQVATGDGGWAGFDPANPNVMYCVRNGIPLISTDGGKTFNAAINGLVSKGNLAAPVAQDPNNPGTLYFGATTFRKTPPIVYKTVNFMGNWTNVLQDDQGLTFDAISVAPSSSNVVYAGDNNGTVFRTTNGGSTWTRVLKVTNSQNLGVPISSLAVNPQDPNTVYVAVESYQAPNLFKLVIGSPSTVTHIDPGLPAASVNVVRVVNSNIFVGLDSRGVSYLPVSAACSTTCPWTGIGSGLPNSEVLDLAFGSTTLYAVTHGRGVWMISTSLVSKLASITLTPKSGAVGSAVAVSGSGFAASSPITVKYDGKNVATVTTNSSGYFSAMFSVPSSTAGSQIIEGIDASGKTAFSTFSVIPSDSLNPLKGHVEAKVTVTGSGFANSSKITITYDGKVVGSGSTSNQTGSFIATFVVPTSVAGQHTVTAMDASANKASAKFTVTPLIKLSSKSGNPGSTVTVSGSGFAGSSKITITFNGNTVTTTPTNIVTTTSGSFSATFVVPQVVSGTYPVKASDASGHSAKVTFTVT